MSDQSAPSRPEHAHPLPPRDVQALRDLFWQNVMQEILTSLSVLSLSRTGGGAGGDGGGQNNGKEAPAADPERERGRPGRGGAVEDLFDGRIAIITTGGDRIPIADVFPLFACGIGGNAGERSMSLAVECSVFQVRTPKGQIFTLPLHEIRGFHSLAADLMSQIQSASAGDDALPFGFAAFRALGREAASPGGAGGGEPE